MTAMASIEAAPIAVLTGPGRDTVRRSQGRCTVSGLAELERRGRAGTTTLNRSDAMKSVNPTLAGAAGEPLETTDRDNALNVAVAEHADASTAAGGEARR